MAAQKTAKASIWVEPLETFHRKRNPKTTIAFLILLSVGMNAVVKFVVSHCVSVCLFALQFVWNFLVSVSVNNSGSE